jgi:hypothetical protein
MATDELQKFLFYTSGVRLDLIQSIDQQGMSFKQFCWLSTVRPMDSWYRSHVWNSYDDVNWLRKLNPSGRFYQLRNGVPTRNHARFTLGQLWLLWDMREVLDWKALVGVADIMGLIRSIKTKEVVGIT